MAERIRQSVQNEKFEYNHQQISVTISLGLAISNAERLDELVDKADHALYQAKENGRNQVIVA